MTQKNVAADETVVIHRHTHSAPPLLVSDATADKEGFRDARAWRKFARAAQSAGFPVTSLGAELAMLRADVEAYVRATGSRPTVATPAEPDDYITAAITAAGLVKR